MAGARIVIVDDQIEAARLLQKNLESLDQDFKISSAFSGEEALLELTGSKTDLLVADFRLPGMTGLELMQKFKARNPEGKVILVSGVTDAKIRQKVAQAGADAFFFKPIDIPEFLDAVERALGLVDTILQPELTLYSEDPIDEGLPDKAETKAGITDQIAELRVSMDATAVLLVDSQGEVLARAGDLPDPELEISMMPVLLRAFTSGVSISHFLGQPTADHFYSFRGENYDLFIVPVGDPYCLMVLTRPILMQQLGSIAEQAHATARTVMLSLSRLGLTSSHVAKPEPSKPVTAELIASAGLEPEDVDPDLIYEGMDTGSLADEALENFFSDSEQKEVKDADAFWDALAEEDVKPELGSGDSLSYDQAAKLGLAPDEE